VLYIVHFTAFCLGGPFFSGHGVVYLWCKLQTVMNYIAVTIICTHFCTSTGWTYCR